MHPALLAAITFFSVTVTAFGVAPLAIIGPHDTFDNCAVFGSDCATHDNIFCDEETKSFATCHHWGDGNCWIKPTEVSC